MHKDTQQTVEKMCRLWRGKRASMWLTKDPKSVGTDGRFPWEEQSKEDGEFAWRRNEQRSEKRPV